MAKPRVLILPYKIESEGAKVLADSLGVRRIIPTEESEFVGRQGDVIINWGNSTHHPKMRRGEHATILNKQEAVTNSVNKLRAMRLFESHGVSIPQFRTTPETAQKLFSDEELKRIFCRTVLNGSGGAGIIIARNAKEISQRSNCQLFVEGIPKKKEYRVHVVGRQVIDYQEKRRRNGAKDSDEYDPSVRNLENGWVYARDGVKISEEIANEAIGAVTALGLDFGAVDLALDKRDNSVKVFEVNTSPGLEGTTLETYTQAFQRLLQPKERY